MSAQDNGGPAFPTENARQIGNSTWHYEGMTLRDYFAAKAMHALVTEPPWGDGGIATVHSWSKDFQGDNALDRFAHAAYKMADAMIKAREGGAAGKNPSL